MPQEKIPKNPARMPPSPGRICHAGALKPQPLGRLEISVLVLVPNVAMQIGNPYSNIIHRIPCRKLDTALRIGWPSRHLHDEPDDLPVEPAVMRVVEPSGNRGRQRRLQPMPGHQFPKILITRSGVLARFPGGQIYRNEGKRNLRE